MSPDDRAGIVYMKDLLSLLIEEIAGCQSTGDRYYPAGLFPSRREKRILGYVREDSNIFFTAITVFTLNDIRPFLGAEDQVKVVEIAAKAAATYELYRNKNGLATYNFYQTDPSNHFPNGHIMRKTRHFKLPDDVDDTVMLYLITPRTWEENEWLKEKLRAHANTVKGWVRTGPDMFRNKKIYSTWFGEKMPIDFDASTLSNVLLWVCRNQLPLDEFDYDVLDFIRHSVKSGDYLTRPLEVSAYYATTPLIMYHIGRLMAEYPVLNDCRKRFLKDLKHWLSEQKISWMDRIMLNTTLLRLGEKAEKLVPDHATVTDIRKWSAHHCFSIAPILNYYPQTRWLTGWKLSHINWVCDAHSLTLVAEYLALRSGKKHTGGGETASRVPATGAAKRRRGTGGGSSATSE
jgi:hypothetical protein